MTITLKARCNYCAQTNRMNLAYCTNCREPFIKERNTSFFFNGLMQTQYDDGLDDDGYVRADMMGKKVISSAEPAVLPSELLFNAIRRCSKDVNIVIVNAHRRTVALAKNFKFKRWCNDCNHNRGCDCDPSRKEKQRRVALAQLGRSEYADRPIQMRVNGKYVPITEPHFVVPAKSMTIKLETPAMCRLVAEKLHGTEIHDKVNRLRWKLHFGQPPRGKRQVGTIYFNLAKPRVSRKTGDTVLPLTGYNCPNMGCTQFFQSLPMYCRHLQRDHNDFTSLNPTAYASEDGLDSKSWTGCVSTRSSADSTVDTSASGKKLRAKWAPKSKRSALSVRSETDTFSAMEEEFPELAPVAVKVKVAEELEEKETHAVSPTASKRASSKAPEWAKLPRLPYGVLGKIPTEPRNHAITKRRYKKLETWVTRKVVYIPSLDLLVQKDLDRPKRAQAVQEQDESSDELDGLFRYPPRTPKAEPSEPFPEETMPNEDPPDNDLRPSEN